MKKRKLRIICLLICLFGALISSASFASGWEMPAGLYLIEEEAFADSGLSGKVEIPQQVR